MNLSEISLVCFPQIKPHNYNINVLFLPQVELDMTKVTKARTVEGFIKCIKCVHENGTFLDCIEQLLFLHNNVESIITGKISKCFCLAIAESEHSIIIRFIRKIDNSPAWDIIELFLAIESLYISNCLSPNLIIEILQNIVGPTFKATHKNKLLSKSVKQLKLQWLTILEGHILKKFTNMCFAILLGNNNTTILNRCCMKSMISDKDSNKNGHKCTENNITLLHRYWLVSLKKVLSVDYEKLKEDSDSLCTHL